MNSKQLIVLILFVFTLCLGSVAVLLLVNMPSEITDTTPTPTPTISITPSPTPSTTPTPLPIVQCSAGCTNAECEKGSTCMIVNAVKRCVLDSCINNNTRPPSLNNTCDSSLCNPLSSVIIEKKAEITCNSGLEGGNKIKIIITITNDTEVAISDLRVTDDLTESISIEYLTEGSISNSGEVSESKIIWEDIALAQNDGSIELTYEMDVPLEENGKSYTNPVVASLNNAVIGNVNFTLPIQILPCTALEQDQLNYIFMGVFLIIIGFFTINKGYDVIAGKLLWKGGLGYVSTLTSKIIHPIKNEIRLIIKQKKGEKNIKFEEKILKDND